VGWGLYAIGVIELVAAWPFQRAVGVVTILLGLDHGVCVWRVRHEGESYDWKTD